MREFYVKLQFYFNKIIVKKNLKKKKKNKENFIFK